MASSSIVPAQVVSSDASDASGSNVKPSEIDISVTSESSNSVELCMRVRGLAPKKGATKLLQKMNKPKQKHPDDYVSNAKFNKYTITAESMEIDLTVEVKHETPARFAVKINKFPSKIDADSVQLSVKQPPGRNYSFIFLRARKKQPVTDWKKYLADNGTLDTFDEEDETKKDSP